MISHKQNPSFSFWNTLNFGHFHLLHDVWKPPNKRIQCICDMYTKMYFAHDDLYFYLKQLFIRCERTTTDSLILAEFHVCVQQFIHKLKPSFSCGKLAISNLKPYQQFLLHQFHNIKNFIVFLKDKNLGPGIITCSTYIQCTLYNQLLDTSTYGHLFASEASTCFNSIHTHLMNGISTDT